MKGRQQRKPAAATCPDPGWLVLADSGLQSVRCIVRYGAKRPNSQRVLEALKEIGLFSFMRTVWKWQKVDICSQFVRQWNQSKKRTFVNDIEIDVSVETFAMVTGLLADESAIDSEDAKQPGDMSEVFSEKIRKRRNNRTDYYLSEFKEPWLRDLLLLLSSTVWMKNSHPERIPVDLINSVNEALNGKRLQWSKTLHTKFICEIRRLQSQACQKYHQNGSFKGLLTVSGPLMCFLYVHAKLKAEALADLIAPFPRAKEETVEEWVEYHDEEGNLPGKDVSRSEIIDEEHSKQHQVSRAHLTSPEFATFSDHRTMKRKLFDQDKSSVSLPASSSVNEDMAAKVLELECIIARQNAELAESRLQLYAKGKELA